MRFDCLICFLNRYFFNNEITIITRNTQSPPEAYFGWQRIGNFLRPWTTTVKEKNNFKNHILYINYCTKIKKQNITTLSNNNKE